MSLFATLTRERAATAAAAQRTAIIDIGSNSVRLVVYQGPARLPATLFNGVDSLLSIVQMPAGVPVATLAVGKPGATNAGLLAAQLLATTDPALRARLRARRDARRDDVLAQSLPPAPAGAARA